MVLEANGRNAANRFFKPSLRTPDLLQRPEIWSAKPQDGPLNLSASPLGPSTCANGALRSVQGLIWHNIRSIVDVPEQEEVRVVLGANLIDKNEVLFSEAKALEEIIRDVQINTEHQLAARSIFQAPSRSLLEDEIRMMLSALRRKPSPPDLEVPTCRNPEPPPDAEPPGHPPAEPPPDPTLSFYGISEPPPRAPSVSSEPQRKDSSRGASPSGETSQTGFASARFAKGGGAWTPTSPLSRPGTTSSSVTGGSSRGASRGGLESGSQRGGGLEEKLGLMDPKEREIMEYVMGERPGTGRVRTPLGGSRPGTASSRGSASVGLKAAVDDLAESLNASRIDTVVGNLRALLADEHAALLEDVSFLQQCLEEEMETSAQVTKPPPSTADMRTFSAKLERQLQDTALRQVQHERLESLLSTPHSNGPTPFPSSLGTPLSAHTPLTTPRPYPKTNPPITPSPTTPKLSRRPHKALLTPIAPRIDSTDPRLTSQASSDGGPKMFDTRLTSQSSADGGSKTFDRETRTQCELLDRTCSPEPSSRASSSSSEPSSFAASEHSSFSAVASSEVGHETSNGLCSSKMSRARRGVMLASARGLVGNGGTCHGESTYDPGESTYDPALKGPRSKRGGGVEGFGKTACARCNVVSGACACSVKEHGGRQRDVEVGGRLGSSDVGIERKRLGRRPQGLDERLVGGSLLSGEGGKGGYG